MIAVVRASAGGNDRIFLAATLCALGGAILLARHCPDFCSSHTLSLSLAVCAALAAFRALLRRLAPPSLICDGRWLAYSSWLLGSVVELDELDEVHWRDAAGGGVAGIALCTRQRELYCLELGRWRGEDLRGLLAALLASHPQTRLDRPTRLWLTHLPPGG